ncbi:hypothetical protein O7632_21820 [Solwaraspora sp. WMMD406]|nr:hypothetical protein [Solwaraspora sp. WMMD406]MDG4766714.1 hypothetical protein [Solwaraspora sp. WMMD406]
MSADNWSAMRPAPVPARTSSSVIRVPEPVTSTRNVVVARV